MAPMATKTRPSEVGPKPLPSESARKRARLVAWLFGVGVRAGSVAVVSSVAAGAAAVAGQSGGAVQFGRLAMGTHGAVVSVDGHATRVGLGTLRDGGNAIDAARAVGVAPAGTRPPAGNLGGRSSMVI